MSPLFEPVSLGSLTLPNRVAMAPMTRSRGTDDHVPNALAATYYAQRAGAGLIITEGVPVSQEGVGYVRVPGLWNQAQIDAWTPITRAVHDEGGRIFAQIWHVGRISHTSFQPQGGAPVAPSVVAARAEAYTPEGRATTSEPVALDLAGIQRVVNDFAAAARNALKAGFDGVEIHGANGYLLEQFLYSGSNHRTDGYGGSAQNRARFHLEVLDAVVAAIGPERVGLRVSPQNTFNDAHDEDRRATFAALAEGLAQRDFAFLHVVEPVNTEPSARLLPLLREAHRGTLIVNGGYRKDSAEAVLARGEADLVAFGSTFLANPDLTARLRLDRPLNAPNPATFYTPGPEGYTDYPFLDVGHVRVVALEVTDEEGYTAYRRAMKPILASWGGRFAVDVRGSALRPEGANRVFVIEFPDAAAAGAFFSDPAYLAVREAHFVGSTGAIAYHRNLDV